MTGNNILHPSQIGFLPNHRTADHILTLKSLIDKYVYQTTNGKIYACFVDLRKAFDSIWHDGLFLKLLQNKIGGKFHNLIKNLYSKSQCAVKQSQHRTSFFPYHRGVRQGCILSPWLFNIYLNDLPQLLNNSNTDPLILPNTTKLNCLLYADDLVLISTSKQGLQNCLDQLKIWCETWLMEIHFKKTKIMIFQKTKNTNILFWKRNFANNQEYTYLGLKLTPNGKFTVAMKTLANKAIQVIFAIKKKVNFFNLKPKLAIKIFDSMISPILQYNSEVWGAFTSTKWNQTPIEKAHLKFCKLYPGVNRKTTNIACRGELGKFPLLIFIHKRMIKYISHINTLPDFALVKQVFLISKELCIKTQQGFYQNVMKILKSYDPSFELNELETIVQHQLSEFINNVKNKYTTFWKHKLQNSSKLSFLASFKTIFNLTFVKNSSHRRLLCQFRTSSHKLSIESGRYQNISRQQRLCEYCNSNEVEDEHHFSISCKYYEQQRNDFHDILQNIFNIQANLQSTDYLQKIMSSNDPNIVNTFSNYIFQICVKKRDECLKTRLHLW